MADGLLSLDEVLDTEYRPTKLVGRKPGEMNPCKHEGRQVGRAIRKARARVAGSIVVVSIASEGRLSTEK